MIEFPCECGHLMKLRSLEGVTQEKLEEIMDMDPFPENWQKLLRAAKQKGEGISIKQLAETLDKRIRPMELQCIHCSKVKNLEELVPQPAKYIVTPYRHPDSLRGNSQMF